MLTTKALEQIALVMADGAVIPTHIAIGIGSSTLTSGATALTTETDRNQITEKDVSTPEEVTYVSNYSAAEISGTALTEFGLFDSGTGGNMFQREVIGSIQFAGDRELQIQMTNRYTIA